VGEQLTQRFKAAGYKVIDLSGARVVFEDGWGLVRPSSNLPELVLRFEARTDSRLQEIQQMFRDILKEYPSVAPSGKLAKPLIREIEYVEYGRNMKAKHRNLNSGVLLS